ncbi:MAG: hypothetical protein KF684_12485 [Phycisphaeraceae bacterium]|nr:hypothetical protein [Phycisphaeraceae bacterium]
MRHTARAAFVLTCLALATAAVSPPATGAVETTSDQAVVRLPAPPAIAAGSFTLFAWLHRDPDDGPATRSILDVPGAFSLAVSPDGDVLATLSRASGSPLQIALVAPDALPRGEWALVTLTLDSNGVAFLSVESDTRGFVQNTSAPSGPFAAGPATGDFTLGATGATPSMRGVFGLVAVRNHSVTTGDARAVFASRDHFAPYNLDTSLHAGNMNGIDGVRWMINHAITAQPHDGAGATASQSQRAAEVDKPARATDFHVFSRDTSIQPTSLRVVRLVNACEGMLYRSPFEQPVQSAGFFLRTLPSVTAAFPDSDEVHGVSPALRILAEHRPPAQPTRVFVSGNSRGVRLWDILGGVGNFGHGYVEALREHASGIAFRPAFLIRDSPTFAIRSTGSDGYRFSGSVGSAHTSNFSRFFTASVYSTGLGPGGGVLLNSTNPGTRYSLRSGHEPGSRFTDDAPITLVAFVLAYPGSSDASFSYDTGSSQSAPGAQEFLATVPLDTARTQTPAVVVQRINNGEIVFAGNLGAGPAPALVGDAFFFPTTSSGYTISVASAIDYDQPSDTTRVTFEHPFDRAPDAGSQALYGPYEIRRFEHHAPPAASPDASWRGLEVRPSGVRGPVALFGYEAYRTDVPGYIFASVGWGGNGYGAQVSQCFSGAVPQWMSLAAPDIWLMHLATQNSTLESMAEFTAMLRSAHPDVQIAWIGDIVHDTGTLENWHRYVLENARANAVPGVTLLRRDDMGSMPDQYVDGFRIDGTHFTQRGNTRIALAALDMLRAAARWPGDANNDGIVSFADINAVLSNFGAAGPADGSLPGDVTLDGEVNFADINAVLSNFGTSAHD